MSKIRKHISEEDFQRYLSNQMTDAERNTFEKELQKNSFETEALEGFQQLSPDELSKDLQELKSTLSRKKPKSTYRYWAAAATLLLLVSSGIIWFQLNDKNPLPELTETKTIKKEDKVRTKVMKTPSEETIIQDDTVPLELEISENLTDPKSIQKQKKEEPESSEYQDSESTLEVDTTTRVIEFAENFANTESKVEAKANPTKILTSKAAGIETQSAQSVKFSKAEFSMDDTANQNATQLENDNRRMISGVSALAPVSKPNKIGTTNEFGDISALDGNVVRGKVISMDNNQPLPGATIIQKDTNNATISDINGNFSLKTKDGYNKELTVSFIGMEKQEIYPTNDSITIIELEPSPLALEEVVTIAYGVNSAQQEESNIQNAVPIGGMAELKKYFKEKAILPENYSSKKEVIKVKIYLNAGGEITKIENKNGAGDELFNKTKQIILDGPKWHSKTVNGIAVESESTLRIVFKKEKQNE